MDYNQNEERSEHTGFGYRPPDVTDRDCEVPYAQEPFNQSIPVGTPPGTADATPVNHVNIPVFTPGGAAVNTPINTPDVTPFDQAGVPVGTPVSAPGSIPGGVPGGVPIGTHGGIQDGAQGGSPPGSFGSAPVERNDIPVSDHVHQQQRMFAFRGYYDQGERPAAPRDENWREPAYSQTHETVSNMYTPGICANPPYPHKRVETPPPERKEFQRNGFAARILGAVCLVILCVALSGVTAYGVVEGWFGIGSSQKEARQASPPVINQVVLGGASTSTQRGDGLTPSVIATGIGMSAEDIYDMACDQVVGIRTEIQEKGGFFGMQSSTTFSGSGFIISSDGYILTNYHVIETAYQNDLPLTVSLHDGTEYDAKVIGYEKSNDVALIKIEESDLNAVIIANSNNIRVGQPVYAVGNPFGDLVYTMTDGIVSALDRVVTVEGKSIETFQFSAAVNSGNSGGPVYDLYGEVIGIVSAKIMGTSAEGIGFAIPINDAIEIASKLIEHGYISGRPLIGVTVNTVTSAHAEYYGWVVGAYIRSISPDSAAEKAGLLVGDIIVSLGDSEVDSMESLLFTLRKYKAGDTVAIKVWRSGTEYEKTITFDENLTAGQPERSQAEQPEQPDQQKQPVLPDGQLDPDFEPNFPESRRYRIYPEQDGR